MALALVSLDQKCKEPGKRFGRICHDGSKKVEEYCLGAKTYSGRLSKSYAEYSLACLPIICPVAVAELGQNSYTLNQNAWCKDKLPEETSSLLIPCTSVPWPVLFLSSCSFHSAESCFDSCRKHHRDRKDIGSCLYRNSVGTLGM